MALEYRDSVAFKSTTTGTGTYTVTGAFLDYFPLTDVADGNTVPYLAYDADPDTGAPTGSGREVGIGTVGGTGTTLARTSITRSTNSNNAVDWGAGTRIVLIGFPATGTLVVRQTGGTVGDDEARLSNDGSHTTLRSMNGILKLLALNGVGIHVENDSDALCVLRASTGRIVLGGNSQNVDLSSVWTSDSGSGNLRSGNPAFQLTFSTQAGLNSPAAAVVAITDGSTGGGQLEFLQVADVGTPSTNSTRFGAEDVAGNAEMIVADEAGTETQISPHAADAPPGMYDGNAANRLNEQVHRSVNTVLGTVEFINLTRLARLVEQIAAGNLATVQALPVARRQCHHQETVAAYNARSGRAKPTRTWAVVQNERQARYDAGRAADQERHAAWVSREAEREQAVAAWTAADPATRGKQPMPPGVEPAPVVRPAVSVKKPIPRWLADRGVV